MKRLPFRLNSIAQGTLSTAGRVGRWLFNLAAALSFLLALMTVCMWIDSHFAMSEATYRWGAASPGSPATRAMGLKIEPGEVVLVTIALAPGGRLPSAALPPLQFTRDSASSQNSPVLSTHVGRHLGFGTYSISALGIEQWLVAFPIWFAIFLECLLPAWWIIRRRNIRQKMIQGRCGTCGYDLRATPERCPECGTVQVQLMRKAP